MTDEPNGIPWGADSEYGRLLDVLLGPPGNFRWLPTSAISKATLAGERSFSSGDALSQRHRLGPSDVHAPRAWRRQADHRDRGRGGQRGVRDARTHLTGAPEEAPHVRPHYCGSAQA